MSFRHSRESVQVNIEREITNELFAVTPNDTKFYRVNPQSCASTKLWFLLSILVEFGQ